MSKKLTGNNEAGLQATVNGFWVSQRSDKGQSILNAPTSRDQGAVLNNVNADSPNFFGYAGQWVSISCNNGASATITW